MDKRGFASVIVIVCIASVVTVVWAIIGKGVHDRDKIIEIVDFELSPDEEKIAFAALTPVGNTDIWVVDIDGSNLKKLTFKDRSPSNHIARFYKKHKWRNFFKIDMHSPEWTKEGRVAFCQELTKYDIGMHTVSLIYWTINADGRDKRVMTDEDEIIQKRPFGLINRYKRSEYSVKHRKKIIRKNGALWFLDDGKDIPDRLI